MGRRALAVVLWLMLSAVAGSAAAECRDPVVLVHGNTGDPDDWRETVAALEAGGHAPADLVVPDWGSKWCAACNNHRGGEEGPVRDALRRALGGSCSGSIDVIAHSMGVTLAMSQIRELGIAPQVDAFVAIAGAPRGLRSCGIWPWRFPTPTCGRWGLAVGGPFLSELAGYEPGRRVYSLKSWRDELICAGGCAIGGVHASRLWNERQSLDFELDHYGLLSATAADQVRLVH